MSVLEKMHPRNAHDALGKLTDLWRAREQFLRDADVAILERHGPQGVSSDVRFRQAVAALFDAHVDHIVRAEQDRLYKAIWSEPTPEGVEARPPSEASTKEQS
jgi:hypothetical protein